MAPRRGHRRRLALGGGSEAPGPRAASGPLTTSYSLRTEVEDLAMVLDEFAGTRALFGWSCGGLIALPAADDRPIP
ncbi:alpha/beta fold hydrolase [Streptomyces sp. 3213.3]|uniref:alpha/beta fold hydrolase n=1 Tax=Streptomyces sp. 3213.3 TaxID=1855348 RepID=UPI001F1A03FA|nr:hypothetical protein [Streptomyces sp. 3213.3]